MTMKKAAGSAEILTTTAMVPTADTASDTNGPANIPPASEIDPSGASQQIVPDVDMSHPAADANPRVSTTVEQNKIDFNDPTISGQEAVERALGFKSADGAK